jgi:hypothetical protein
MYANVTANINICSTQLVICGLFHPKNNYWISGPFSIEQAIFRNHLRNGNKNYILLFQIGKHPRTYKNTELRAQNFFCSDATPDTTKGLVL